MTPQPSPAAMAAVEFTSYLAGKHGVVIAGEDYHCLVNIISRHCPTAALHEALVEAIEIIEDLYRWEPITAGESEDGPETFKGWRGNMPVGLVEMSNAAGIPPEEMNPKLERLKAALAPTTEV